MSDIQKGEKGIRLGGTMFEKREHKYYFRELALSITIGDGSVIVSS